ncbi:MAG: EamA family transporter [Desulfobacteraceae bacterium]|nr:MAG: EamA family transporter [Desulfobacteraceae bacterium]
MKFQTSNVSRGYAVALLSSVILSTTAIFIRHLTQTYQMPALVLAFWREGFVVLTLLVVLGVARPALLAVKQLNLFYVVIYGFVLSLFNATWTLSVALNGAAVSTVLVYCSAAFTALLGWWFLKEELGWGKILAVVLCLAGCVLVADALNATVWRTNLLGIFTGISAGLCYAVYSLMGRSASQRGLNPWTIVFYTFGIAMCFMLAYNLLPGGFLPGTAAKPTDMFWLGKAAKGWIVLFLLAAGPTLLGFGLYNVSLSLLPASVTNLILTSEPVFTAILAFFLFNERLSGIQIIGSILILSGVVFLRVYELFIADQASLGVTDAQRDELDRRLAAHKAAPEEGQSWGAIKEKLEQKK